MFKYTYTGEFREIFIFLPINVRQYGESILGEGV